MPKWHKRGRIISLQDSPCRSNHMQCPVPYVMEDRIRIYYTCRNNGKSFPAFLDVDKDDPSKVIAVQESRIMDVAKAGAFDCDGVMPGSVIYSQREILMYYTGWNARSGDAGYQNEIGLAVSTDGGETFTRKFIGPIVSRSKDEPWLAGCPHVLYKNWFRMFYISGTGWEKVGDGYEPSYVIKYAQSVDGVNWRRDDTQCVRSNHSMEAFASPSVILAGSTWHLWYCYRGSEDYRGGAQSYRIGYSQSQDGINFLRADSVTGIELGLKGEWDSEMQCYPNVVDVNGRLLMFYNGNGFGQTGIGWAEYGD